MRFISHLDMTRFMARMIKKAALPIWYTEGFHSHAYITFALPLSLGFESEYEIMDIRLEDDDFPIESICERLNNVFPEYVQAFKAAEPKEKAGKVGYASFFVRFDDSKALILPLKEFLESPQILCSKRTKRGEEKQIDLAKKIVKYEVTEKDGNTVLDITLPAGSNDNVNPQLLCDTFFQTAPEYYPYTITKTSVLNTEGELFK